MPIPRPYGANPSTLHGNPRAPIGRVLAGLEPPKSESPAFFLSPSPRPPGNLITFFFLNINSTSPIHPSFLTNKSTMPRQRSVGRAPSRPTASAPAPKPQQARPAATMAAPPPAAAHPPPQAMPPQAAAPVSQGPGLFGQMASTAA